MTRRKRKRPRPAPAQPQAQRRPPPPEPVDVVGDIPDRSAKPAWWKLALLALIFGLWVGFLIYCGIAGAP